jgi:hypothetical protein
VESTPKFTISADGTDALNLLRKLGSGDSKPPRSVPEKSKRHSKHFGPIDVIQGTIEFPSSSFKRIAFRMDPMNPAGVVITNAVFGTTSRVLKSEEIIKDLLQRLQAVANEWCDDNNITSCWAGLAYDEYGNTFSPK